MSKRSIKKFRHYKTTLSFKERVHLGMKKNSPDVAEVKPLSDEHIHGENCNH